MVLFPFMDHGFGVKSENSWINPRSYRFLLCSPKCSWFYVYDALWVQFCTTCETYIEVRSPPPRLHDAHWSSTFLKSLPFIRWTVLVPHQNSGCAPEGPASGCSFLCPAGVHSPPGTCRLGYRIYKINLESRKNISFHFVLLFPYYFSYYSGLYSLWVLE